MPVRPAEITDSTAALVLLSSASKIGGIRLGGSPGQQVNQLARALKSGKSFAYDVECDLLGLCLTVVDGEHGPRIEGVYVAPKAQGEGLGRRLLAATMAELRAADFAHCTLEFPPAAVAKLTGLLEALGHPLHLELAPAEAGMNRGYRRFCVSTTPILG